MNIIEQPFGVNKKGATVPCFTCDNGNGLQIVLMPLGATLVQMYMPDAKGNVGPICLGFPDLTGYMGPHPSFGTTVGRFCNRIAGATFSLDGKAYKLSNNEGIHHIHGGERGLGRQFWSAEPFQNDTEVGVTFTVESPAGDMGYPGNIEVKARYSLDKNNRLRAQLSAETDAPTHINLTNHTYWNLAQETDKNIHQHLLEIDATHILAIDKDTVPNGDLIKISNTPFDFTTHSALSDNLSKLNQAHLQAENATKPILGFDHCYTQANPNSRANANTNRPEPLTFSAPKAILKHPHSGRCLSVSSTQPGLQLYTSHFLSGQAQDGHYTPFSGICLEPQAFPNAPNIDSFPSTRLDPGHTYQAEIHYDFWTEKS